MARVLFNLREVGQAVTTEIVQYTGSSFSSASLGAFAGEEFFIDAVVTDYDKVRISWNSPIFELGPTARPVETFIRWSLEGEPQTIEDGLPLTNSTLSGSYLHTPDNGATWQGKWVYYSLFLKYASTNTSIFIGGEQYYEKVASVSVLITKNYGSIDDLWTRIPEYYRLQDAGDEYLYRFLSVFAWDLDTLRTVIDYTMIQKDPQVASSYTLQKIMEDLGAVITTLELGATRARNYTEDILNQRLSKGTEGGITSAIQAISGSLVTIDKINKEIQVSPQRINWARDPRITQSFVNGWYTASATNGNLSFLAEPVYFYGDSVNFNGASLTFDAPRDIYNPSAVEEDLFIYSNYTIPFEVSDTFYISFEVPVEDPVEQVILYRSDGTLAASAGPASPETVITRLGGKTFYVLDMSEFNSSSGEFYTLIYFKVPPTSSFSLTKILIEKEYIGDYFDGYTNTGGWITGTVLRSDYRWSVDPNTSYSLYSADDWRTRKTLERIYKQFLPVLWQDIYSIVFDKVPYQNPTPQVPTNFPITVGTALT